jgi:hypothetical protein
LGEGAVGEGGAWAASQYDLPRAFKWPINVICGKAHDNRGLSYTHLNLGGTSLLGGADGSGNVCLRNDRGTTGHNNNPFGNKKPAERKALAGRKRVFLEEE